MKEREFKILTLLINEYDYITLSGIANKLHVSTRTILRSMKNIENWLRDKSVIIESKTGVGIKLIASKEQRRELLETLCNTKTKKEFTPDERYVIITSELLNNKEPIKMFYFTSIFDVTEGTISNDLDKVEKWLQDYDIELVRRQGLGIYITAKEKNIRRAIINLLYENIEQNQLINLTHDNISHNLSPMVKKSTKRLLDLVDDKIISKLEKIILQVETSLGYNLTDDSYIGILVHMALAIKRISHNESIGIEEDIFKEIKQYKEFDTALIIGKEIEKNFEITLSPSEIAYIAMHLRGSKVVKRSNSVEENFFKDDDITIALAKKIILQAQNETGYYLENNEQIITALAKHLGPTIYRLKMNMKIRNPLLDEIKRYYPYYFNISKKCVYPLEEYLKINLPESEIAYIAMHLGAAIKLVEKDIKVRVGVVCISGIGMSRLLSTNLHKNFNNLEILDNISIMHLNKKRVEEKRIDLIISTVKLYIDYVTVIQVTPLLLEEDKAKIQEVIKSIYIRPRSLKNIKDKQQNNEYFKSYLEEMHDYDTGILNVLNQFNLREINEVSSIEELIIIAAKSVVKDDNLVEILIENLLAREKLGSTLIPNMKAILLHRRSDSINKIYFSVLRLKKELLYKEEAVNTALILLVPKNVSNGHLEIASYISQSLIDIPDFADKIMSGSEDEIYIQLNRLLKSFYRSKIDKLRR